MLSPLGLDPAHPFPRILNKTLNIVVMLKGVDAFGRAGHMAIVRAPRSLPRIIKLPERVEGKRVAIIGGGPTGMAAAYFCGRAGIETTIFERERKLGGVPVVLRRNLQFER